MSQPLPQSLEGATMADVEKGAVPDPKAIVEAADAEASGPKHGEAPSTLAGHVRQFLLDAARSGRLEGRGIAPVPPEERTVKKTVTIFTLWWTMNTNILGVVFGILAPTVFGLQLRDAALIILFFMLLTATLTGYFSTLGPKTGMRQMVQARYSWGRYPVTLPVILNLSTMVGFMLVQCIIGSQCLSAVASGSSAGGDAVVSQNAGIVIIALLALFISFCGYRVLHVYEQYASIPAAIALAIVAGLGAAGFQRPLPEPNPPATAANTLSFGMIVASYMIPYAPLASDFTAYMDPKTSSTKIFAYCYAGLVVPSTLLMILGAAIGSALPANPTWKAGYDTYLVGGALDAILAPAGGFGKFVVVVLAFSLLGNLAATSYSVTLNMQQFLTPLAPRLLRLVPRYAYAVLLTAVLIPVAIALARDFLTNLENFIALIAYWSSGFVAVLLAEHFWFRGGDAASYDPEVWNDARRLPPGVAALASLLVSFGAIVPFMAQAWWTGPVAKLTGDIGFELAFVVAGLVYLPLRTFEKKIAGR
ncbi:hypothetical protein RB596_009728 [Gaeumannomyces avenae]